ncbi:MAG: hypothetical protein P8I99_09270 [Acidimicrobiales bacterium]|nr:hypothetical protein [Acidimicrobiales bacterium]
MGDRLMLDLLGEVPEDQRCRFRVSPAEQLVAVAIHPAGSSECGCLESGCVGDRKLPAHAPDEEAAAPLQPTFNMAKRWMLGDEELVEASMLLAVFSLLLEVGVHLKLERLVINIGESVARGLHHVGLALGHAE